MKSTEELRRNFEEARELNSDDKLVDMLKIREEIANIERSAMKDLSIPLNEIVAARDLLGDVDAAIGRLEAGRKRRQANAEAKS